MIATICFPWVGEQSIFCSFEMKAVWLQKEPNRQQLGGGQELPSTLILKGIGVLELLSVHLCYVAG